MTTGGNAVSNPSITNKKEVAFGNLFFIGDTEVGSHITTGGNMGSRIKNALNGIF